MKIRSMIFSLTTAALLAPLACLAADSPTPAAADPVAATDARPKKLDTACDNVTGTRIRPSRNNKCTSALRPFRTYSQEELERTGEINLTDALRKIDTIFQ